MSQASLETSPVSDLVRRFFIDFAGSGNTLDLDRIGESYAEEFMFGTPESIRVIKRDDLLKALPNRKGFFEAIGLKSTTYTRLEETRIDAHHILVEAYMTMHFEKEPGHPVENHDSSTFLLRQDEDRLRIACHIEHDDLKRRMQSLGLLPPDAS